VLRVRFRLSHQCAFTQLSRGFPEVTFSQWCDNRTEFMELDAPDAATVLAVRKRLKKLLQLRGDLPREESVPGGVSALVLKCPHVHATTVERVLDQSSMVVLYPIIHRAGWESYQALALDGLTLRNAIRRFDRIGDIEVIEKRAVGGSVARHSMLISFEDLFSGLTWHQQRALLLAMESGYYDVPRRSRLRDIARDIKVPRTTFGEHLQKGEGKLVRALAPFLTMNLRAPTD
jgi:predicted DNA binding protein